MANIFKKPEKVCLKTGQTHYELRFKVFGPIFFSYIQKDIIINRNRLGIKGKSRANSKDPQGISFSGSPIHWKKETNGLRVEEMLINLKLIKVYWCVALIFLLRSQANGKSSGSLKQDKQKNCVINDCPSQYWIFSIF